MGVPTKEDRLSIGLSVPEIEASQKRDHGRPADRSYSGFPLILSRTRLAFGLARNKQVQHESEISNNGINILRHKLVAQSR